MSAVYFGQYSVLASVPGISAQLSGCKLALDNLKAVVDTQLAAVAQAAADVNAQIGAISSAKIAIRIPAVADFQAQADAAASVAAGFTVSLTDPTLYIAGLLEGLAEVSVNINALVPQVALNAQLSATLGLELSFNLKIAAVDLQLQLLVTINAALALVVSAILAIQVALSIAVSAALNVAVSIAAYLSSLSAAAGAHAALYDGPLAGLGAAIDLVTPSTGIGGAVNVRVPIVIVEASNTVTIGALNNVFRVAA